ncbi:MAG: sigma-70 family RNA polymerase sigma factor, partial [Candidatus Cloacimonadota bacterium]|nr:sigma-70 family RNA polymerase sigma factor [Candidatus Cloacimonadota bacterium]
MRENIYEDKTLQKYLSEIAIYAPLSREEEKEYALRAQKNDSEALQILIRSNLKFVVKIAANYQNRGLSFAELISEGNMGLIKAIEKFEPQKKNKLISYAVWWIKQRILFALAEKTSTIRIPLGKSNVSKKIRKAKLEIRSKEGREATMSEIMEKTDLEKKAIKRIYYQIVTTV